MAKRPSVKEILEAARRGGPAKQGESAAAEESAGAAPEAEPVEASEVEEAAAPAQAADVPTPEKLGRPLTLKEKLAAARAGGAPAPAGAKPAARPAPAPAAAEAEAEASAVEAAPAPAADIPTPEKLGRPLTLKENLAAAKAGGASAAPAAGAKPAAPAKAAASAAGTAPKAAARTLPPLEKMTDPKDLAEALRRTGAKEDAAKKAEAAPAKPAAKGGHKDAKPQTVLPKPSARPADAAAAGARAERRRFLIGAVLTSWIFIGWSTFVAGCTFLTVMCVRFMFPNVLAEPPSTIKIGLPSTFDPEDVNERFKAEWGFWVVRSARVGESAGDDIVYALKSVCTHLGCPPNWLVGEQKFKCPCHGSGFYITGVNFEGPAPRPLERFKVTLADDGQIIVDKSQIFQQELGQWTDADSFIKV